MTSVVPPAPQGRAGRWRLGLAAVLAVLGVGSLLQINFGGDEAPSTAPASSAVASTAPAPAPAPAPANVSGTADGRTLRSSVAPPVALSIPAIDVSTPLITLGLNPDKTVEVPENPDRAGWYRLGPPPGARGSAVILGHVDSTSGPAVFAQLKYLVPGDKVDVETRDGSLNRFEVESVATYPNEKFPARQVYAPQGYRALNLVTCGGVYDRSAGGYQSNVVVSTRWVRTVT